MCGDRFGSAPGDIATTVLRSHGERATGESVTSLQSSHIAAESPEMLVDLQRYCRRSLLPQPLEREWLRHDPELKLFTHARSERIAASVLARASDGLPVHLVTGAAHQPGVTCCLRAHRDGD